MAKTTLDNLETGTNFRGYLNAMFTELYQLLTGKAGGGTVIGGTLTNQDLNLRSNATDLTTGSVNVLDSLEASSKTVGALTVAGGLAVAKKLFAGASMVYSLTIGTLGGEIKGTAGVLSAATPGTEYALGSAGLAGGQTITGSTLTTENLTLRANAADTTTGAVIVASSKDASSKTVGSVQLAGGLAVAKKLYAGAAVLDSITLVNGETLTNATDGTITSSGLLDATGYTVSGIQVVGAQVAAIGLNAKSDADKITDIITALRAHGLLGANA